jgi:hypothetical protein
MEIGDKGTDRRRAYCTVFLKKFDHSVHEKPGRGGEGVDVEGFY